MKKYTKATYVIKRHGKTIVCHCKKVYTEEELAIRNQKRAESRKRPADIWESEQRLIELAEMQDKYEYIDPQTLGSVYDAYSEYRQNVLDCEW